MLHNFIAPLLDKLSLITAAFWAKWLAGCIIVGLIGWLHHNEHKLLQEYLHKPMNEPNRKKITSLICWRSTHMIILLFIFLVYVILQDIRTVPTIFTAPATTQSSATPPQTPAAGIKKFPSLPERDKTQPFDGISLFSEKDADRLAYLDLIKQRYEKILVTYFYLEECKATSTDNLEAILNALNADLLLASAPPHTSENTIQAAKGTFEEIYAHTTCRQDNIIPIKQSFEDSLTPIRQRLLKTGN